MKVTGAYWDQYDQAGLMVRFNERVWLKCGVEFVDGVQHASAVVTREHSDWSVAPLWPLVDRATLVSTDNQPVRARAAPSGPSGAETQTDTAGRYAAGVAAAASIGVKNALVTGSSISGMLARTTI